MSLIGRKAELALVTDRLRDRRLVTLVGSGGIGKTALARAAVTSCQGEFGEGSRIVDLTRVDAASGVHESVAAQIGYTSFRALLEAPGDHSVLILVDNCEHVVDAVADAVGQLLDSCRMPTVLATSRTALELPGEAVVPVGPLELPPVGVVDAPAVRLFVERARDAGADLAPSELVAELCRRLDGVPLAIELAAARTRSMTPAEILDRLAVGLDVLDRPRRRAARRHQSLRAAIDWSYHLLDDAEQELFRRLSVFSGPFTAEMAGAVAGAPGAASADVQDLLDRLVSVSLVSADTGAAITWFRVLGTLRSFGLERLDDQGDRHDVEGRFVDHVVGRVAGIIERGAATWSERALADLLTLYDNIAAAVRWCVANDADPGRALLLAAALWGVVHQAHTEEIGALAELVLDRWPDPDHPLHADAVATAATCRYMLGDHDRAIAMATTALDAAKASPFAPVTLRRAIAQSRRATGDTDGALAWFAGAADEARRLGLGALAVEADAARAQVLADLGHHDDALALVAAARAEAVAAGSELAAAWTRSIEGSILLRVDAARAVSVLASALAESRRLGYAAGASVSLRCLALAALGQGEIRTAAARVAELLDELLQRGSTYELRLVLDVASPVLARAGRRSVAADLAATALSLPVVSITASVGHELFPLEPASGRVLPVRDAILVTRTEVTELVADDAAADAPGRTGDRTGVFRRAGDHWEIGLDGDVTTARATKGMDDLATLLQADGREVHCLELIGAVVQQGDTGEVLDATARRAYEERVRELQREIDEADADNDSGRAERARVELDDLVDQLAAALGLGGRTRTPGGSAERARSAVTQRVRTTIRRIETVAPRLGRHLNASIRTGTFCSYRPEEPVRWQL
jgi:predicted ATPase